MVLKIFGGLLVLLAAMATAKDCDLLSPGSHYLELEHDGLIREYLLHVPKNYVSGSVALLIAWHGISHDPEGFEERTQFSAFSDTNSKFIVAYPAGIGSSWNAGSCCPPAKTRRVDDYGFARTLVKDISNRICIDTSKVYTTGYSNGCFMSQGLICHSPDIFRASACGSGGEILLVDCDEEFAKYNSTLDILEIHGTLDPVVPYGGNALLGFPPVLDTFADHRRRLECQSGPIVTYSQGNVECEQYYNCNGGKRVEQCTVKRGTHDWYDNSDINNSKYILDFLDLL